MDFRHRDTLLFISAFIVICVQKIFWFVTIMKWKSVDLEWLDI